jgi:hypothetical protein
MPGNGTNMGKFATVLSAAAKALRQALQERQAGVTRPC